MADTMSEGRLLAAIPFPHCSRKIRVFKYIVTCMFNKIFKTMRSTSPSFCCWSQVLRLMYMNDVIPNFVL